MKRKILFFVIPAIFSCCSQSTNQKIEHSDSLLQEKLIEPTEKEIILSCADDLPGKKDIDQTKIKGIGLVNIKPDSSLSIYFYDSLKSMYAKNKIDFIEDKNHIGLFCLKLSAKDAGAWFRPLHFYIEFGILTFQCIDTTEAFYKVIVKEVTNQAYWIRKNSFIRFQCWSEYLLETTGVEPINPIENPIRTRPERNSPPTVNQPIKCIRAVKITDDWMKIITDPTNCDQTNEMKDDEKVTGYIRWKSGNNLLIKYYLSL